MIHGLHEEIVNKLLLPFVGDMFEQSVHRDHLASEFTSQLRIFKDNIIDKVELKGETENAGTNRQFSQL